MYELKPINYIYLSNKLRCKVLVISMTLTFKITLRKFILYLKTNLDLKMWFCYIYLFLYLSQKCDRI